jgi:hypothetical protein
MSQLAPPRDIGPPAAPLLMLRQARRTIAEHRMQPHGYLTLAHALKHQMFLIEDAWVTRGGLSAPSNDRTNIRNIQLVTALHNYLQLEPDDWILRLEMAKLLYKLNHLDAGLVHLGLTQKSLEKDRQATRDKKREEALRAQLKNLGDFYKDIEGKVRRRRNDYDLQTSKADAREKLGWAVVRPYKTVDDNNRDVMDYRGMGLALEGLKQLDAIGLDNLKEEEKSALHALRFRLLAQQGRVAEASGELNHIAPGSPALQESLLWHAAALGAYEEMDNFLAAMEKQRQQGLPPEPQRLKFRNAVLASLNLHVLAELPAVPRAHLLNLSSALIAQTGEAWREAVVPLGDWRTLRGILALETGNVAKAQEHFAEALRVTGVGFPDRPIAERYLELLRDQK